MEDLLVFEPLVVSSHKGDYQTYFNNQDLVLNFDDVTIASSHFIIDAAVAEIYSEQLARVLKSPTASVLIIEATEKNKSLDCFPAYVEHLVKNKLRRNQRLIAIGGGIIQDITCFLAATMLRGVEWWFYPTTLLAQADSCIGSKSSINCGSIKNILGTFTPPQKIFIYSFFLNSLNPVDLYSGIGEMLKVHAIEGPVSFDAIAKDYQNLFSDSSLMLKYMRRSLEIKKGIIEQDEFDKELRHVMNYGHTFGHAIESATQYKIPHGVAVTIGMDMANYVAVKMGLTTQSHYERMHPVLKVNYADFVGENIPLDKFLSAISKDKKNIGDKISLILLDKNAKPGKTFSNNDQNFHHYCASYLESGRLT